MHSLSGNRGLKASFKVLWVCLSLSVSLIARLFPYGQACLAFQDDWVGLHASLDDDQLESEFMMCSRGSGVAFERESMWERDLIALPLVSSADMANIKSFKAIVASRLGQICCSWVTRMSSFSWWLQFSRNQECAVCCRQGVEKVGS